MFPIFLGTLAPSETVSDLIRTVPAMVEAVDVTVIAQGKSNACSLTSEYSPDGIKYSAARTLVLEPEGQMKVDTVRAGNRSHYGTLRYVKFGITNKDPENSITVCLFVEDVRS